MNSRKTRNRAGRMAASVLVLSLVVLSSAAAEEKTGSSSGDEPGYPIPGMQAYTGSHADNESPPDILGGPVVVEVTQKDGSGYWVLPGPRELDPSVFGTPEHPVGFDPAPFPLLGVPLDMRLTHNGKYTIPDQVTPFSNWAESVTGSVTMKVTDRTAVDGKTTKDKIDFEATFNDPDGATYRVVCKKPIPHGIAYPFFGGVVTNHILHGVSGIGSRLMPTEFSYVAFWGTGDVFRNNRKIGEDRIIHVMITEFVRGEGYKLVTDRDVGHLSPAGKTIHLLVPPFKPANQGLEKAPLKTGFIPFPYIEKHMKSAMEAAKKLPESEQKDRMAVLQQAKNVMDEAKTQIQEEMKAGDADGQPFFHVMFNNFEIKAKRG